jgi:hypothetical protein
MLVPGKLKLFFVAGIACLALASCKTTKKATCPPNVMCTMMFKSISVQVKDANGHAVLLDEAYTVQTKTKETIRPAHHGKADGYYVVLDDSYQKKLQNMNASFRFIGIKDGKEVISQVFRIGADCCHISKIEGPEEITLQ